MRTLLNGVHTKFRNATATDFISKFLEWSENSDGPWAACINLIDAHTPYQPASEHNIWGDDQLKAEHSDVVDHVWEFRSGPRPWSEKESHADLYDGAIHQLDAAVGELVETLRDRDDLENTFVVITADHGEAFGEVSRLFPDRRLVGHCHGLHDVLFHVPLLVHYPGSEAGAECVDAPASLTRFPDAVAAVRDDSLDPQVFVPDSEVCIASPKEGIAERVRAWGFKSDEFNGRAVGVVREEDGMIVQCLRWNDKSVLLRDGALVGEPIPESVSKRLDEMIDAASSGIVERIDGHDGRGVSDTTERRLRELGYLS